MAKHLLPEAEQYTRRNRLRQIWQKFVRIMACVVVFCTTYALILPAITMEKDPVCGLEEHTHSESCYIQVTTRQVQVLQCTYESLEVHAHFEDCYDPQGTLTCGVCDYVAHTHDDACTDEAGALVCVLPEIEGHVHGDSCYVTAEDGENVLVCSEPVAGQHVHGQTCFVTMEAAADTQSLTCGQAESDAHTHTALCRGTWELRCTLTAHTHTDACVEAGAADLAAVEEDPAVYPYIAAQADTALTVDNVNYYEKDRVILIDGATVAQFADPEDTTSFGDAGGLQAEAKESFASKDLDLTDYTAVIIENLDNGQDKYIQYYVDAVITSTAGTIMNPGTDMTTLAPKTENGFIVYIPNGLVTEKNLPARGDLVTPNFWHGASNVIVGYSGTAVGTLSFSGNPAAEEVLAAATAVDVNATVKMFDYGREINQRHPDEFLFWNGDYGFGADQESVDGWGADFIEGANGEPVGAWPYPDAGNNISMEAYHGYNRFPDMLPALTESGWPQMKDRNPNQKSSALALDYLFDGRYQTGSTMTDGGGLFQQDADGYYYYDSAQNAAYFDGNRFTLYRDLIVRPWADSNDASAQAYGNFLPLNRFTADNITLDGYVFDAIGNDLTMSGEGELTGGALTGWQGSLAAGGGQSHHSVNATLESDGNNRLAQSVFENGKYTARLEEKSNLWFGMTVDFEFCQPVGGQIDNVLTTETDYSDMIFDFHGDDDVLVYVGVWNEDTQAYDYRLVLDLSGVHEARSGSINFASGAVHYQKHNADTDVDDGQHITGTGSVEVKTTLGSIFDLDTAAFADHTKLAIKFFYLERGGNISYCRLRFNMPTLPQRSLTVTKELEAENGELKDFLNNTYSYAFRVVKASDNGEATTEPMIISGNVYDILEDGKVVGTGTVGADGWFTLKAGQSARFDNMAALTDGYRTNYFVEERMPTELAGQYGSVRYEITAGENTAITPDDETTFTTFRTAMLRAGDTQQIIYRNVVDVTKLGTLTVSKTIAPGARLDADLRFRVRVKLDDRLLPSGTAYTLTAADGTQTTQTVEEAGIILLRGGESATLVQGILAGTAYEVTEPDAGTGYYAAYSGTVNGTETVACTESGAAGTVPLEGAVRITVTNSDYQYAVRIPISKQALHNTAEETFVFDVTSVVRDGDAWTEGDQKAETAIMVTDSEVKTGEFFLTFQDVASGTYCFRVSERPGDGAFAYDETFYIVEITVDSGEAAITKILKNGTEEQESGSTLAFVNRKLTDLSVSKTVTGAEPPSNLRFDFTATVTNPDGSVFKPAAAGDYTVAEDGTIAFALADGETVTLCGIPIGATVTVTEAALSGYTASWAVDGGALADGNTATAAARENGTIAFFNDCAYLLPETGGAGTSMYTLAGLMLILCGMAVLLYRYQKRRREVL